MPYSDTVSAISWALKPAVFLVPNRPYGIILLNLEFATCYQKIIPKLIKLHDEGFCQVCIIEHSCNAGE